MRLARRTASGGWQTDGAVPDTRNASFAVSSARHHRLYAVREEPEGAIDVLVGDSEWRKVGSFPTLGAEPCHCALDASETFLAAANYGSGSITVWRLGTDGMPEGEPWRHQGHGSGPNPERQDGPHAHWVGFTPDQRWLVQIDLGTDRVWAFPFDPNRGITGAPKKEIVEITLMHPVSEQQVCHPIPFLMASCVGSGTWRAYTASLQHSFHNMRVKRPCLVVEVIEHRSRQDTSSSSTRSTG